MLNAALAPFARPFWPRRHLGLQFGENTIGDGAAEARDAAGLEEVADLRHPEVAPCEPLRLAVESLEGALSAACAQLCNGGFC